MRTKTISTGLMGVMVVMGRWKEYDLVRVRGSEAEEEEETTSIGWVAASASAANKRPAKRGRSNDVIESLDTRGCHSRMVGSALPSHGGHDLVVLREKALVAYSITTAG